MYLASQSFPLFFLKWYVTVSSTCSKFSFGDNDSPLSSMLWLISLTALLLLIGIPERPSWTDHPVWSCPCVRAYVSGSSVIKWTHQRRWGGWPRALAVCMCVLPRTWVCTCARLTKIAALVMHASHFFSCYFLFFLLLPSPSFLRPKLTSKWLSYNDNGIWRLDNNL